MPTVQYAPSSKYHSCIFMKNSDEFILTDDNSLDINIIEQNMKWQTTQQIQEQNQLGKEVQKAVLSNDEKVLYTSGKYFSIFKREKSSNKWAKIFQIRLQTNLNQICSSQSNLIAVNFNKIYIFQHFKEQKFIKLQGFNFNNLWTRVLEFIQEDIIITSKWIIQSFFKNLILENIYIMEYLNPKNCQAICSNIRQSKVNNYLILQTLSNFLLPIRWKNFNLQILKWKICQGLKNVLIIQSNLNWK